MVVHEAFDQAVARHRDATALVFLDQRITYGELKARADCLASVLRRRGIDRGAIVGILTRRSPEMLVAILATLKAGAAYLPLDPTYPSGRLDYTVSHSRAALLLTDDHTVARLGSHPGQVPLLCLPAPVASPDRPNEPGPVCQPEDLAYIIYTSGSTGVPKGVMIEHGNLASLMTAVTLEVELTAGTTVLALTTISFDIAIMEILIPLAHGMTVILASEEEQADDGLVHRRLLSGDVDMLQVTPSRLRLLLSQPGGPDCIAKVKQLMVAGEPFPPELFARLKGCPCRVYNLYGPTETTVYALVKRLYPGDEVTIGRPLANTRIRIVDASGRPVRDGEEGELLIGGAGVARGYLQRPELTAAAFIADPERRGERLYRTGDLVRTQDGEVQFLGRLDRQIKLRGYRIELEEIERRLVEHPAVVQATVLPRTADAATPQLCAYVVLRDQSCTAAALRSHLARSLPHYMIPAFVVPLENFPLLPNGKVDQTALPNPAASQIHADPASENALEEKVRGIWAELLGVPAASIGRDDSFIDLGGNSLVAGLFLARLAHDPGVRLPMAVFLAHATIRQLAVEVAAAPRAARPTVAPTTWQNRYPLSSQQQRLFFLHELEPSSLGYNVTAAWRMNGVFDSLRILDAATQLLARHESLRTTFEMGDDAPVQMVHAPGEIDFAIEQHARDTLADAFGAFVRPFDLACAPLFRIGRLRAGRDQLLAIDFHHIVCDGYSWDILMEELSSLLSGEPLPPVRFQYRDYVAWQRDRSASIAQKQGEFWLKMFDGYAGPANLPLDRPRPSLQRFRGRTVTFSLAAPELTRLKGIARSEGTTLFVVLLASIVPFVAELTRTEDVVVGTPIAGRSCAAWERIVGMFVNTLALRVGGAPGMSHRELVRLVNEMMIGAFENQDYQFYDLVLSLDRMHQPGGNPLFNVMFVLQDTELRPPRIPGVRLAPYARASNIARVDLTIHMREQATGLAGQIEYDNDLFDGDTIESMRDRLLLLLTRAADV